MRLLGEVRYAALRTAAFLAHKSSGSVFFHESAAVAAMAALAFDMKGRAGDLSEYSRVNWVMHSLQWIFAA